MIKERPKSFAKANKGPVNLIFSLCSLLKTEFSSYRESNPMGNGSTNIISYVYDISYVFAVFQTSHFSFMIILI